VELPVMPNRATLLRRRRRLLESLEASNGRLRGAIKEALGHYERDMQQAGRGLFVAWDLTAHRMAQALERALGAADEAEEGTP
jgi:hypothetical protein